MISAVVPAAEEPAGRRSFVVLEIGPGLKTT